MAGSGHVDSLQSVNTFPYPQKREYVMSTHEQIQEPIIIPTGFGQPRYKIGDRVRISFTTLAPAFLKSYEGKIGTVVCIVFCKSDGRTILYGVDADNGGGGRFESFELDPI